MATAKKPEDCITQEELKKQLHYNPDTGIFTRLIAKQGARIGDIAGWYDSYGYIRISINCKTYKAHRLAWFYVHGEWPDEVDHIKHIRDDNRISELRAASPAINRKNQSLNIKNTSGVTGVYWDKVRKKWKSQIKVNKKVIALYSLGGKFEAVCARKSAENKYGFHENHGEAK